MKSRVRTIHYADESRICSDPNLCKNGWLISAKVRFVGTPLWFHIFGEIVPYTEGGFLNHHGRILRLFCVSENISMLMKFPRLILKKESIPSFRCVILSRKKLRLTRGLHIRAYPDPKSTRARVLRTPAVCTPWSVPPSLRSLEIHFNFLRFTSQRRILKK